MATAAGTPRIRNRRALRRCWPASWPACGCRGWRLGHGCCWRRYPAAFLLVVASASAARRFAASLQARCLLGFGLAGLHAAHALCAAAARRAGEARCVVTGRIVDLPEHEARRTRFLFRVDPTPLARTVAGAPAATGLVRRRSPPDAQPAGLKAGQPWALPVRVRRAARPAQSRRRRCREARAGAADHRDRLRARAGAGAQADADPADCDAWREAMSATDRGGRDARRPRASCVRWRWATPARSDDIDWDTLARERPDPPDRDFRLPCRPGRGVLRACSARMLWWLWPALGASMARADRGRRSRRLLGAAGYAAVAGLRAADGAHTADDRGRGRGDVCRAGLDARSDALALAAIAVLLVDPLSVLGRGVLAELPRRRLVVVVPARTATQAAAR